MSYRYNLYGPNREEVTFESETMLTRNQAKEKAAELFNCQVGPIADAQTEGNAYPWKVTLASGKEVKFTANQVLSEEQAVDFAIDLNGCRTLIEEANATFKMNTAEIVPSSRSEEPLGSLKGQAGIDFSEPNVIAGWLAAGIFAWLMVTKLKAIATNGNKFFYILLVLAAAALYGLTASALYESYSIGFAGGANSPYSLYPSLLVDDTVRILIPLILGILGHLAARRIIKNSEAKGQ